MNDNEDDFEEITEEEMESMLSTAASLGGKVEQKIIIHWLRQNASDFLFAADLDPKLQEYGTTVLELVADAIEDREHWTHTSITLETIQ